MARASLAASMEAIDVQTSSLLFKELTIHFEKVKEEKDFQKAVKKYRGDIIASVKNHTGINIDLKLDHSASPNAYVIVPQIDRNHPLLIDFYREVTDSRDGMKLIKKNDGVLRGSIDRSKSMVGGEFSKIPIKVALTRGLFLNDIFTPQEISGILLHELGHIFTYFEYLGTNITTNYVLQHVSKELLETREIKRKYQIIQEGSDALGIKVDDPEALTKVENGTVIQTVLLRKVAEERYSELNSTSYDMTAWEMLSDQFATRHGAGRSLVTALDKMFRMGGSDAYKSVPGYLATEAFKMLLLIISAPLTLLLIPFLLLVVADANEDIYDRPRARLERIRRDMVDAVKKRDIDTEYRKQLNEDIEVIDKITAEMTERRTFLEYYWSTLRRRGRHSYQQVTFQQELEKLVNNDLFVQSSKLKTLAS